MIDSSSKTIEIESATNQTIDAAHLTLLPGLIDPHVHFRVPGQEYKEDWFHAGKAAIKGGYSWVFDMPNNIPPCITKVRLQDKKRLINSELAQAGVPLRYDLYFGADRNHFDEIYKITNDVVGIKVFMGSTTGELLMDDDSSLHAIFALAAKHHMLIAVHAEDEAMLSKRSPKFTARTDHAAHSELRTPEVAARAVEKAIFLSKMYDVALYILHVSTIDELALIADAKAEGLKVYAETTPHHLFLSTKDYEALHGRAQMNPPLRDPVHQEALFKAIREGVIDTIGSDHAPHTAEEKDKVYGKSPSGVPGIETTLPLLLNAVNQGKLILEDVVRLTRSSPMQMFQLESNDDFVLVDMRISQMVEEDQLRTKCGWSPFVGKKLQGWPKYSYVNGQFFDLSLL